MGSILSVVRNIMRPKCCFFLILFVTPLISFSQVHSTQWFTKKFKNADTVLLISHVLIAGSTDLVVDRVGRKVSPNLMIKGQLNRQVLTEEQIIKGDDLDTLLHILLRPNQDSIFTQGGCFVPRQSIILIRNHKTSFIDICFHCSSYETSKDLKNIPAFDTRRWTELEDYFRKLGLTYQLDEKLD